MNVCLWDCAYFVISSDTKDQSASELKSKFKVFVLAWVYRQATLDAEFQMQILFTLLHLYGHFLLNSKKLRLYQIQYWNTAKYTLTQESQLLLALNIDSLSS